MSSYLAPGVHIEHVLTEPKRILQTGVPVFLGLVHQKLLVTVNKGQSDQNEHYITQPIPGFAKVVLVRKRGYLRLPPRPLQDSDLNDAAANVQTQYVRAIRSAPPTVKNQQLLHVATGAAVQPGGANQMTGAAVKFSEKPQRFTVWPQFAATYADLEPFGLLSHAVRGFFANGGRLCYVQLIGYLDDAVDIAVEAGLTTLADSDEYDLVCVPDLMWLAVKAEATGEQVRSWQTMTLRHCEQCGDRMAILDAIPQHNSTLSKSDQLDEITSQRSYLNSDAGALYYPWLRTANGPSLTSGLVPPCGHVAGVIARTDHATGVHKAPANEELMDVLAVAMMLTDEEQGPLNALGINCIRAFTRRGIRIWGARTLSAQSAWQYVNVRRVITTAVRWIERNMNSVVFEPHTPELWARIERDLTIYFTKLLEQGALSAQSGSGAFYVKCNEETNPPEEREVGRVVTEIGLTPVVPTEFIVIRIIHGPTGARIVEP